MMPRASSYKNAIQRIPATVLDVEVDDHETLMSRGFDAGVG